MYDSKNNDKSAVIDVFCTKTESKKVISSGPVLLVEFDTSSNETSNGFSGVFRFLSINGRLAKLESCSNLSFIACFNFFDLF